MQRIVFLLVLTFIGCVACVKDETVSCSVPDGRVLATSTNDRARRAMYVDLTDAQFDSVAKANCWHVPR